MKRRVPGPASTASPGEGEEIRLNAGAVCSFIGFRVYDIDISARVCAAVSGIVEKNEMTEFLLYNDHGQFFLVCLQAVMKVKSCYPSKDTVTFVVHEIPNVLPRDSSYAPFCAADKIIAPLPDLEDGVLWRKSVQRWILHRSTYVVSYLYDQLNEVDLKMIRFVKKSPSLNIVDVCNKETAQAIKERSKFLTEREQRALQELKRDYKVKDYSASLSVTRSGFYKLQSRAALKLRQYAASRFMEIAAKQEMPTPVCGIFRLGETTYETISYFWQAVRYLVEKYQVTRFEVEGIDCPSVFMSILRQSSRQHKLHITAVISDADLTEAGDGDIMEHICPPCDAVLNVDTTLSGELGVIVEMMDRSVFCICNLPASPAAEEIRRIARASRTMLLDIGRKPVGWNL